MSDSTRLPDQRRLAPDAPPLRRARARDRRDPRAMAGADVLSRNEGINQGGLAELLEVEPITLCRMVDRLEEAGLVERRRDPADRRAWQLFLTDKSRPLLDELRAIADELIDAGARRRSTPAQRDAADRRRSIDPRQPCSRSRTHDRGRPWLTPIPSATASPTIAAPLRRRGVAAPAPSSAAGCGPLLMFGVPLLIAAVGGLFLPDRRAATSRPTTPMSSRTRSRSAPTSRAASSR